MRLIIKAMAVTSGAAAVALALIACGDPKYQPPAIVVTFSPYFSPPTALNTGSTLAPRQALQQSLRTTPRMAA
jgi:hypothetical protein